MTVSAENWQTAGFGLYVHWPFCASKCPYCDFNSHVRARVDEAAWAGAYAREIARAAAETPGRVLSSIFLGGGTPSLMAPDLVAGIIEAARQGWTFANDIEITMEANPSSVEAGRFAAYRDAGVNRVSIGVQALVDEDLRRLGRLHSAAEARRAVELALAVFPRVSLDLIYARQFQTLEGWQRELAEALALGTGHLSLYQLTIEDGTAFAGRMQAGGLTGLPGDELGADLFTLTAEMTERAGLPAYEISNHGRPGEEARHNLIYWRSGDWAGVGPGAHGRLTLDGARIATSTPRAPEGWLAQVRDTGTGELARETLGAEDRLAEFLLSGLRLTEGVLEKDMDSHAHTAGKSININELVEDGLLASAAGRVRATERGRLLLNAVLAKMLA